MARPSEYKPEYAPIAHNLALMGADEPLIASVLGISISSVESYKRRFHDFKMALKTGKTPADAQVASKLYQRAVGYTYVEEKAVKVRDNQGNETVQVVEVEQHVPPDVTACIFWLKNRQKEHWRDKHEHNVTGQVRHERIERVIVDAPAIDTTARAVSH